MNKITLDIEELKQQRQQHQIAIERIDWIIENFFKGHSEEVSLEIKQKKDFNYSGKSRMRMALELCESHLKSGQRVRTMDDFMKIIEQNQIKLSRAGLGLALKLDGSNIIFDKELREWKLKE